MSEIHLDIDIGNIYEAVAGSGITFNNDVDIINTSTLSTDGLIISTNTTPASVGTGAIVVQGGISLGNTATGLDCIDVNAGFIRNGPTTLSAFTNASDFITKGAAQELATGLNVFSNSIIGTVVAINTFVSPTTGANVITKTTNAAISTDQVGGGGDDLFDSGATLNLNDLILVKDDARSSPNGDLINGIYEITDLGSVGTPWVLTRITGLSVGDSAFQAYTYVSQGNTESGGYIQTNSNPVVVGTDPLKWEKFIDPVAQTLASVLSTGNDTGSNLINIQNVPALTSSAGTDIQIDAGTDDLQLLGNNLTLTSTTDTNINAVNITTTATGNLLDSITGTSTINADGITLGSTAALALSGTTANMTANTGDLSIISTAGSINITENNNTDGINITTNGTTITINNGANSITVSGAGNDIVAALNLLNTAVTASEKFYSSFILTSIPIKGTTAAFGTFTTHPIYWNWDDSRYGTSGINLQSGVLIAYVITEDVLFQIRNTVGDVLLQSGTFSVGATTTNLSFTLSADTNIYMDFRSAAGTGVLQGLTLEYTAQNSPP